jgi:hypothetical protein
VQIAKASTPGAMSVALVRPLVRLGALQAELHAYFTRSPDAETCERSVPVPL